MTAKTFYQLSCEALGVENPFQEIQKLRSQLATVKQIARDEIEAEKPTLRIVPGQGAFELIGKGHMRTGDALYFVGSLEDCFKAYLERRIAGKSLLVEIAA